jgi:hypothetical protein
MGCLYLHATRQESRAQSLSNGQESNEWFCQNLTVKDTKRADGTPVISPDIIEQERLEGMEEALIQQEFYGSFEAQIAGAYFADQIATAKDQGRVTRLPIEPSLHGAYRMGSRHIDSMSIWLFQAIGKEIRLIGYYENNGKGMEHYIQWLNQYASTNNVMLGQHLAPHDIEVRELTSGRSRKEVAREMGISSGQYNGQGLRPKVYKPSVGCSLDSGLMKTRQNTASTVSHPTIASSTKSVMSSRIHLYTIGHHMVPMHYRP